MKFEMNRSTLDKLISVEYITINIGLVEHKYSFRDIPIVINTNKPDGIVQLGRDSIDLTHTDNIRGSLESLIFAEKRREGGRVHFGPGGAYSVHSKEPEELRVTDVDQKKLDELRSAFDAQAKGSRGDLECMPMYCQRDIDAMHEFVKKEVHKGLCSLTEALSTWVNSEESSLTVYVVADSLSCDCKSDILWDTMMSLWGVSTPYDKTTNTITTAGNRRITVVTKNQSSKITEACQVVYDHTVQGN